MKAKLIGVSVGPGNPELMTLQAVRTLEQTEVIAYVKTAGRDSSGLTIASQVVDMSDKILLELPFLMVVDPAAREDQYRKNLAAIVEYLEQGKDVALLNLGDISVYSTFGYMAERAEQAGFETVWLPGVTSFCAGASAAGISLAAIDQPIHLIPGRFPIDGSLDWPGTKIYMKSASAFGERKHDIEAAGRTGLVLENISRPEQSIRPLNEVETSGYFSLIIVKEPV